MHYEFIMLQVTFDKLEFKPEGRWFKYGSYNHNMDITKGSVFL